MEGLDRLAQSADLILQVAKLRRNLLEVVRFLEIAGAAIRGVETRQIEVAASLAWGLPIAFDLSSLALVAIEGRSAGSRMQDAWCAAARLPGKVA